jgi:7-carboxy-7-deazaguanine synthase
MSAEPTPLRLLELYYSTQGEGPRVGAPTIFVRFAGCNLRCPGWPLSPCDTPHAIDPRLYRKEQEFVEPIELARGVIDLARDTGARNVCLTGGEPMLQPATSVALLLAELKEANLRVEMFSNGTLPYGTWIAQHGNIVLDWKLPGSGEVLTAGQAETRALNLRDMQANCTGNAIKFTVASMEDLSAAHTAYYDTVARFSLPVFVGPVWGQIDPKVVVDYLRTCRLPWRLTLQVHKYIWRPDARFT